MPSYSSNLNTGYRLDVVTGLPSQEVANNRSLVNWELRITRTSGGVTAYSNFQNPWSITINGTTYSGSKTYNFNNYSYLTLGSGQIWVTHNADGTKTVPISASFTDVASANYVGDGSVSASYVLTAIPRASKPTTSPTSVDANTAVTINTNRASTSFTHKIEYSIGSSSGVISTNAGASVSWTPPLSLLNEFPSATSGTVQIRVWTYSSSTQNSSTYIGYNTVNLTVKAPTTIVPTFTSATFSEGTPAVGTAGIGSYVQNVSKLAFTFNGAAGVYGSTISSYKVAMGTVSGTSVTNTGLTPEIPSSGTVAVVATVTDSRGRTFSRSYNISVLAYSSPTISSYSVVRALSDGALAEDGTYIKATLSASVSSLVVGTQKNTSKYTIRTRQLGTTTWTTKVNPAATSSTAISTSQTFGTYSGSLSFEVEVSVTDRFRTTTSVKIIPIATIFMHWDGNIGVGIGKFRSLGMLDVKGSIYNDDGQLVLDVADYATFTQAQEGTVNTRVMTPLRVAQAITALSPEIQKGTYTTDGATLAAHSGRDYTLAFPTAFTKGAPMVVANSGSSNAMFIVVKSITTTGCTLYIYNSHTASINPGTINWIGIAI